LRKRARRRQPQLCLSPLSARHTTHHIVQLDAVVEAQDAEIVVGCVREERKEERGAALSE